MTVKDLAEFYCTTIRQTKLEDFTKNAIECLMLKDKTVVVFGENGEFHYLYATPFPSDMTCLDNIVLYGAWVYSFNEDALCHTFEYRKDVQAAYILYKELKNNAECSNVEVMFACIRCCLTAYRT